jgi:uncharacterized RDD family membrane protein YckC
MHTPELRYAGFWRRLGAGLVDLAVLLPLTFLAAALDTVSSAVSIAAVVLGQLGYYAYILPLTKRFGGTLGKLAMGIRVRPADATPLTWRHVWRRSAVDLAASALVVAGTVAGHAEISFEAYQAAPWHTRYELLERAVPWHAWANNLYLAWLLSEFVVVLLNPRRRALHDFIAGTVVVVVRGHSAAARTAPSPAPAT